MLERKAAACPSCKTKLAARPDLQPYHQQLSKEEEALSRRHRQQIQQEKKERQDRVSSSLTSTMQMLADKSKDLGPVPADFRKPYRAVTSWADQLEEVAQM